MSIIDANIVLRYIFVDCLLWAYHTVEHQTVFTFDNKLHKFIEGAGNE